MDNTISRRRLGLLIFNSALDNLSPASIATPPLSSTIGFTGFKTQ